MISTGFGSEGAPDCCSNQTRAVSYANGTVFTANIDASVIAIVAKTGKKKWEFLGVAKEDNPNGIYGYNTQPVIVGDSVVIGTTGGEAMTHHSLRPSNRQAGMALVFDSGTIGAACMQMVAEGHGIKLDKTKAGKAMEAMKTR